MYATAVAYLLNALSVYATDNQVVGFKEIIVDVSARNYNDFDANIYSTGTLKSTFDSPYVFKGSISEIRQWSAIRFKVNSRSEDTDISYGFNTQADFDRLPDNVTLTKGLNGNAFYQGASTTLPVNVVTTLSADQSSLDVKFITPAPVSAVIDGVQYTMCGDLNEFSGSKIDLEHTLSVGEGGSTSISVKIGDKTYGIGNNEIVFDAGNHQKQELVIDLVENAPAAEISQKGTYTLALIAGDDCLNKLSVTRGASDKELSFNNGNAFTFNEERSVWSGTVRLIDNEPLPSLRYSVLDDSGKFKDTYYYIAENIDGADRQKHRVRLTANETSAVCRSAGTYNMEISINAEGMAEEAVYVNTDVEIKDLYVCMYDKHYRFDPSWYQDRFFYGADGSTFSFDYKVPHRREDGSYAVVLCMDHAQSFYVNNNGVEYRPAVEDINASFGNGIGNMNTFTFSPSEDPLRRKYVSDNVSGYRMLIIKPNGPNLDVSGYVVDFSDDAEKTKKMNVIRNLQAPTNDFGHMADVIVKFTGGEEAGMDYLDNEYRRLRLNPSGTHGLYDLKLNAGQTFEIYRGRAIYENNDPDGRIIGIEDADKVQYGCSSRSAEAGRPATITDGDISNLVDQYSGPKTTTYKVVRDGEFSFIIFYTATKQQFTISRKVPKDRGIKIAVYDTRTVEAETQPIEIVDMQYKSVNRRNLMTVRIPKGGCAKFGFQHSNGVFEPFDFYYLGLSNNVGYDDKPTEENREPRQQFNSIDSDYGDNEKSCWYRFRVRLREDNSYYLSHQVINMPDEVWLYVNENNGSALKEYSVKADADNPGHYIFTGVDLPDGAEYYFVNRKGAEIDETWQISDGDPADNLTWYAAHTSSQNGGRDGNPVLVGREINMFSHLNVGTDYQGGNHRFHKFGYSGSDLRGVDIDMHIPTMSHRYSCDYTGRHFQFVGSCVGIQATGDRDWGIDLNGSGIPGNKLDKYRFVYHPSTGYYTCYLEYLWGDWFIYNYDEGGAKQTVYYSFDLNNVVNELNEPYYLSDGQNWYVSETKQKLPTGTAAETQITVTKNETTDVFTGEKKTTFNVSPDYKNRFMIAMAPNATALIQTEQFQMDWVNSPVYKDVTVVFDPSNNALWLQSGEADDTHTATDPYGELYLIFTDVDEAEWNAARERDTDTEKGEHWVKLTVDPQLTGHYTATGIKFPARQIGGGETATHSSYFFSNRLGGTLAETIRYSNSYHAGDIDPDFDSDTEDGPYGSVFTKLSYNKDATNGGRGCFDTDEKPLSLVNTAETAYADVIYMHRWDNEDGAPYNDCVIPGKNGNSGRDPRRGVSTYVKEYVNDGTETESALNAGATDDSVEPFDPDQTSPGTKDFVLRTFASEPYVYNVDVNLGRREFTLVTDGRDDTMTGVDDPGIPDVNLAKAVIRAAAGHISVIGADSVSIFTLTGQCLLRNATVAEIDVEPGIYIIVADGRASKHAL